MELWQKQSIFAENVSALINFINDQGFKCTLGECFRTAEQAAIYAKEGRGIQDSLHCKRLALDLNLFSKDGIYFTDRESYLQFGEYWRTLHPFNRWGGDWRPSPQHPHQNVDPDHFEMLDN